MPTVKRFQSILPNKEIVDKLVINTLDSYSIEQKDEIKSNNKYSFLNIVYHSNTQKKLTNNYFTKAKKIYNKFKDLGFLLSSNSESLFIYRQESNNNSNQYIGIVGLAAVKDYLSGHIKIHEQTLENKEKTLSRYLENCDINAEPVVLTYPNSIKISKITKDIIQNQSPKYSFSTSDGKKHELWQVVSSHAITDIENEFKNIDSFYIADGHHRTASSVLLAQKQKTLLGKKFTGKEAFNYFLAILLPFNQVKLYDYSKLISTYDSFLPDIFLTKLSEYFLLKQKGKKIFIPQKQRIISMYYHNNWYSLTPRTGFDISTDPIESLDASILYKYIIKGILKIKDFRKDKRITFSGSINSATEIKKRVDSKKSLIGFVLHPVSMQQISKIADLKKCMPPKSTWVEPKLLSGLIIYELELDKLPTN